MIAEIDLGKDIKLLNTILEEYGHTLSPQQRHDLRNLIQKLLLIEKTRRNMK